MQRVAFLLLCIPLVFSGFASPARAQSVPIKSIPVAEGDQFLLFPSERGGMGGVSIALDDRLHDPFENPAKAARLTGVQFLSSPVYYGFGPFNGNEGEGSGRTLPIGALINRDGYFGGAMLAYQELVPSRNQPCCAWGFIDSQDLRSESSISMSNLYLFGLGGLEIPGSAWSLGVSAFHGQLGGMEGVSRLYSAEGVRQDGTMQQFRAGAYRDWKAGHTAELVLMLHRFDMTHTVREPFWQGSTFREEHDKTQSFAMQAGYSHAFATGWNLGGRFAGDWKWHPKIPNYDLMQIPRDPGNSSAYNIGIGLSTTSGAATFGIDVIYEPIWSHTWANATEPVETVNGETIQISEKTVDNQFVFSNARIRMGVFREGGRVDFSAGVDMHGISYDLDQMNFVENQRRLLDQHWTEWTFSAGVGTDISGLQVQYTGRLTLGTGTPTVRGQWGGGTVAFTNFSADWVVAPNGPLTLQETKILSHQVVLIVPLER